MAKKKTQRKTPARKKAGATLSKSQRAARKPRWSIVTYEDIETWRQQHKLAKKRMAMLLGVTNSTYHNWARGISIATYNTQRKIREVLDQGVVPAHVLPVARRRAGAVAEVAAPSADSGRSQLELTLATDLVKAYVEANPGKVSPEGLVDLIGQVRGQLKA